MAVRSHLVASKSTGTSPPSKKPMTQSGVGASPQSKKAIAQSGVSGKTAITASKTSESESLGSSLELPEAYTAPKLAVKATNLEASLWGGEEIKDTVRVSAVKTCASSLAVSDLKKRASKNPDCPTPVNHVRIQEEAERARRRRRRIVAGILIAAAIVVVVAVSVPIAVVLTKSTKAAPVRTAPTTTGITSTPSTRSSTRKTTPDATRSTSSKAAPATTKTTRTTTATTEPATGTNTSETGTVASAATMTVRSASSVVTAASMMTGESAVELNSTIASTTSGP